MSGSYLFSQEWRPQDLRDEDLLQEARDILAELKREREEEEEDHGEQRRDQEADDLGPEHT